MPVPPFVAGSVLTAAQMNLGAYQVKTATAAGTATTLTVDDAFTADFRYYRMFISGTSATASDLTLQLTTGGVAATTTYYWNQVIRNYNAANTETNSGGSTSSFLLGALQPATTDLKSLVMVDILDPAEARVTGLFSSNFYNTVSARSIMGGHMKDISYDGFKLTATHNLTLSISIYGFVGA